MDKILSWLGEQVPALFKEYGWQASLAVIASVTLLALLVMVVAKLVGLP